MDQIGQIMSRDNRKKPPAYQWQDFALQIIQELNVPIFKRNSVFKIAKDFPRGDVEKALTDTKELAQGDKWKYFFKVISQINVERKQ